MPRNGQVTAIPPVLVGFGACTLEQVFDALTQALARQLRGRRHGAGRPCADCQVSAEILAPSIGRRRGATSRDGAARGGPAGRDLARRG